MNKLVVGGVPEHFNWPWLEVLGTRRSTLPGIEWRDYPGGSGAMGEALDRSDTDVAMLLTEAAVAGIAKGGDYRILCPFTRSPLVWGIHVPAESPFEHVDMLRGARYAISRFGSGSHLMSYALAREHAWPTDEIEFVVVGDLAGAVSAFADGRADVFLWEKFMTKPLVESGQFRRVGEFVAPWPAFVVCVGNDAWRADQPLIVELLAEVFERASDIAASPDDGARRIAAHYGLAEPDVREWLGTTCWATEVDFDPSDLDEVIGVLTELGLVPSRTSGAELVVAR